MIPTHNEEKSIGEVVLELLPQLPILIIASACADRSTAIAEDLGCIVIESDIGYESACMKGYSWALEHGLNALYR